MRANRSTDWQGAGRAQEPPILEGLARMRALWRLWRNEADDPEPFYTVLAREAVADLDRRYGPLTGQTVVDIGCGPGFYTRVLARGWGEGDPAGQLAGRA